MYIEKRKNAYFLKRSYWDKEAKRVRNTSIYLASNAETAKAQLSNHISDCDEIKRLAAKIDELDRPKPAEIIKDVVSFLERAETLAVLAGDTGLADALANASELIKTYNRKKM